MWHLSQSLNLELPVRQYTSDTVFSQSVGNESFIIQITVSQVCFYM